ncbi:hypothetical protein DFJ73DRAFT_957730 [Zopfochytrium polystomum]|nr:hypothetical protein DFJ73DRAFT_957730 [Zopfochytrium polystomum]
MPSAPKTEDADAAKDGQQAAAGQAGEGSEAFVRPAVRANSNPPTSIPLEDAKAPQGDQHDQAAARIRSTIQGVQRSTDQAMRIMQELVAVRALTEATLTDQQKRAIDDCAALMERLVGGVAAMSSEWESVQTAGAKSDDG